MPERHAPAHDTMYESVLLPTDGSDGSIAAAEVGLAVAADYGARAHALYVIDERWTMTDYDMAIEAAEAEAERALDAVERVGSERSVVVEKHLRRGIPHREIVAAIGQYGADLVVLGTYGRTGVDRLVNLGSVTERVVRTSPVQVLTVPVGGRAGTR